MDQPPDSCAVSYKTDCGGGCVISAIDNMVSESRGLEIADYLNPNYIKLLTSRQTHQVQDQDLDKKQQGEALKFLMHLIGDLHQPLHVENMSKGGNGIHVRFDNHGGKKENLHSVWDTDIPHKINGIKHRLKDNEEKEPAAKWATKLFQSQGLRPLHAECADIQKPMKCSMVWAAETNRLNCDFVFQNGIEWLENNDLGGEYYEGAAPIVEMQILKAGIRLAAWLNALAADRASSGGLCTHQGGKVRYVSNHGQAPLHKSD